MTAVCHGSLRQLKAAWMRMMIMMVAGVGVMMMLMIMIVKMMELRQQFAKAGSCFEFYHQLLPCCCLQLMITNMLLNN